ncbi:hydrolase Nlp/P60 [bacterium LRH843]|nr:hydrolase Nlp/P60 [bacterium LRH843]
MVMRSVFMLRKFIPVVVIALLFTAVIQTHTVEASKKDDIVSIAKEQLGVPYRYGGTTTSGFDCSGFIRYVMDKVGISLPRTVKDMHGKGTSVAKADLEVGDLVFFKTVSSGPSHAGIYVGNNEFIHSATSKGVSISSINDPYYWGSRYLGAKRVLPAEEEMKASIQSVEPARVLGQGEYHDVLPTHWAFNEIKELSIASIISGHGDKQFAPNDKLTRSEIAAALARATNLKLDSGLNGFRDVPEDHWAAKAIAAADRAGYFSYLDGETFDLNKSVTREEVAVLFSNAFNLTSSGTNAAFADVSRSNWAYEEIQALHSSGIVNGFSDGTYRPNDNITRAEFSKILHTVMK